MLMLSLLIGLVGCSGGSSSNPNSSNPSVTSVAVSPASTSVPTGATQQFTATVSGSQGVSQAVTWSSVGAGTINSSGLFTASSSPGQATVMAVSQQDNAVSGSAAVTVSQATVDAGDWYGNLTSSDGTQTMSLDFHLMRTGGAISTTSFGAAENVTANSSFNTPCGPSTDLQNDDFASGDQMAGTISGQSVSLDFAPYQPQPSLDIALTGTMNGSTISGTFTSPHGPTCLSALTGTFSFQQYSLQQTNYTGTFMVGLPANVAVPFTLSINNISTDLNFEGITIGACSIGYPAYSFLMNGVTIGRFFEMTPTNTLPSQNPGIILYGLMNDPTGQTLDTFSAAAGGALYPNCLSFETLGVVQTTLTATP